MWSLDQLQGLSWNSGSSNSSNKVREAITKVKNDFLIYIFNQILQVCENAMSNYESSNSGVSETTWSDLADKMSKLNIECDYGKK